MKETLGFDPGVSAGSCGKCRREIPDDVPRLDLVIMIDGASYEVTFCRPCLSEYAPEMLSDIEAAPA